MFQLYNQSKFHNICESENIEELEVIKFLLNKHYPTYKEYKKNYKHLIKTKYDEEYSNKVKFIEYLENKIKVIEYEIENDIDKKNNQRNLYDVKLKLKAANIIRTNLEETIRIEQNDINERILETIPENIVEIYKNSYSFLDYCIPTISKRK